MKPWIPLVASGLVLFYGAVSAWSEWAYRDNAPAPSWCKRWLLDGEKLAQAAYPLQWEGEAGRAAAVADFQLILARDSASARRWCDLGDALLESGQAGRAKYCFTQAMTRAPNSPIIGVRAANFYFRIGERGNALRQMSLVLQRVADYDAVVFNSYSRFSGNIQEILGSGIPADRRAAHSYLKHLLAQKRLDDARAAWEWISARSLADDAMASIYVAALLNGGLAEDAAAAWTAYLGPRRSGYRESNYLFNAGFESDPSGCVLDCGVETAASVEIARDPKVAHAGAASLRIRFDGSENLDYRHVSQTAVIRPGEYRLEAWLRVEGIPADQGVGLHIFDPKARNRVDAKTAGLTGTTGWTRVETIFRVPNETQLVVVQVTRPASTRPDDKIPGAAWIDDVALRRLD